MSAAHETPFFFWRHVHASVPDGFIAHAAGPIDGGYQVTELWESEAAHSAWVASHVLPAMPPGAIPPIVTTRPITKIATRA